MENISVRKGETLPLIWNIDEEGADTATLTVTNEAEVIITKTVNFDGLTANLTLSAAETDVDVGEYEYMVTIDYTDGTVEKYPDVADCNGCTLPAFNVCVANDEL